MKLRSPKLRSPLRYPGGKSRAVKALTALIPDRVDTLVSPFLGGGSLELACLDRGIRVYGYDSFRPLVAFWQNLIADPQGLADRVAAHHPLSRDRFYTLQQRHRDEATAEQAVLFFVLNRASFSGTTLSGGCSEQSVRDRFTVSSIERLRQFVPGWGDRFTVEAADFHDSLDRHPKAFLYLDPPYAIGAMLYGNRGSTHRGFDHEGLAAKLRGRSGWILSYNDCSYIRDLYQGFEIQTPTWSYGMSHNKKSRELLILNR